MTNKKLFGLLILLALAAIAVLLVFVGKRDKNDPKNRVEAELQLIQENKLTEAYYAFTSKEFQAATSLEQFKHFIQSNPELKNSASVQLEEEEEAGIKTVLVEFASGQHPPLKVLFQLIKDDDAWKILNIKTHAAQEENASSPLVRAIVESLEYFFKVIKNKEPERAYRDLMNKEFRAHTSLDGFKDFLGNYPILLTFDRSELDTLSTSSDFAVAKLKLSNQMQESTVDFTLAMSKEGWKIQGVQVLTQDLKEGEGRAFVNTDLSNPIQDQLKALHAGKLKDAYDLFTSKAFKEATSFDEFEKFIRSNPILQQQTGANFEKLSFNNNVGIYTVRFKAGKQLEQTADFSMIHEGDNWKVLQIQLYEPVK